MATYFITTQQIAKLVTSRQFMKNKFILANSTISKAEFDTLFNSSHTLAYSSQFEIVEGDILIFTDHVMQCKAMAEVKRIRPSISSSIGSSF